MPTQLLVLDLTYPELWCIRNQVRSSDHGRVWDRADMQRVHAGILTLDKQIHAAPSELQNTKALELTYRLEVGEEFAWRIEQQVAPASMWGPLIVGQPLLMKVMRVLSGDQADADLPPALARELEEVFSNGHSTRDDASEGPGEGPGDGSGTAAAS